MSERPEEDPATAPKWLEEELQPALDRAQTVIDRVKRQGMFVRPPEALLADLRAFAEPRETIAFWEETAGLWLEKTRVANVRIKKLRETLTKIAAYDDTGPKSGERTRDHSQRSMSPGRCRWLGTCSPRIPMHKSRITHSDRGAS